jgi:hypothetical protein
MTTITVGRAFGITIGITTEETIIGEMSASENAITNVGNVNTATMATTEAQCITAILVAIRMAMGIPAAATDIPAPFMDAVGMAEATEVAVAGQATARAFKMVRIRLGKMWRKASHSTPTREDQVIPIMGTTATWATKMFIGRRTIRATVQVINPTSAGVAEDGDFKIALGCSDSEEKRPPSNGGRLIFKRQISSRKKNRLSEKIQTRSLRARKLIDGPSWPLQNLIHRHLAAFLNFDDAMDWLETRQRHVD